MRVTVWKVIGLAGLAGVAAGGAVVARNERKRRAYTPDEIRGRLHQRVAEAAQAESALIARQSAQDTAQS
ncbi:hypothetical protein [Pseudonocardia xishanensis]|uniref:Secreted protein n=1 Tax=Pseudonocardia xishanensis TaxID=630995 RepID=A0ABP8RJL4_9PSEU